MPGRRRPDWDAERDINEGLADAPEPAEQGDAAPQQGEDARE